MQRVDAHRGPGGSQPFHAAYHDGLALTFRACHAPMPARMEELIRQLGERESAMSAGHAASGNASTLAPYYEARLPRRE